MTRVGSRTASRLIVALALATTAITVTTGCTVVTASSKAGEGALPQSIVLAGPDPAGLSASDEMLEFARLVAELSDGAMTIEVRFQDSADPIPGFEVGSDPNTEINAMVREGDVELALLPDWTWIPLGAKRIAALKTPFLVTDDRVANRLAVEPVAGQMLAELERFGVQGLVLLPETIRHPVAFDRPIQQLGDFDGMTLRAMDPGASALFEALGADTLALAGNDFAQAVGNGRVQGADSAFAQHRSLPRVGTFTGDLGYFVRMNTLVASTLWYESLDETSRSFVDEAARLTREFVIETNPTDAQTAKAYCDGGGTVVNAGPDSLAEIRRASEPVRAAYEQSEPTRAVIDEISKIVESVGPPEAIQPCEPDAAEEPAARGSPRDAFPEGSFRAEVTKQSLLDAGIDAGNAANHAGVWTLTFSDGKLYDLDCPGSTYSVNNGRVSMRLGPEGPSCGTTAGGELFSAEWSYDGTFLTFVEVRSGADGPLWQTFHETLWGGQPWIRVS